LCAKKGAEVNIESIKRDSGLEHVSDSTITRRLNESEAVYLVVPKRAPFVSQSNIKKRLEWCHAHKHWENEDWARVIWSDESPFTVRCQARLGRWVPAHEDFANMRLKGTVKHERKIMVWGCFSRHGMGELHWIDGKINKEQYLEILEGKFTLSADRLFSEGNFIFQQDNDPKHTSHVVRDYLRDQQWDILDWPSQSPDLNPIENLWYILDRSTRDRACNTEAQLFEVLQEAWRNIDINILNNLVDSMPRRIQAVIAAKGLPSKY
jgi:hypothetical protein